MSITKPSGKKIASFIGYIVIILFAITTVVNINRHSRGEAASILGYKPIIIISGSMEPQYMTNSVGLVKGCSVEDVEIGDVIMFKHKNMKIIHRAIDILEDSRGKYILTKGDANDIADGIPITDDVLIGKLVSHTNKAVPIVNYFMVSPGELNPVAITQTFIMMVIIISIVGTLLYKLTSLIKILYIVIVKKETLSDSESKLRSFIAEQEKLKEKICLMQASDNKLKNLFIKAKLLKEIDNLQVSITDFEKEVDLSYKIYKWVNKGSKEEIKGD